MTPHEESALGQLMRSAQDGDQRAYETLLIAVARLVRRFVAARATGAGWTEDVVQETLLTLHRARHTYDPARPFGPWLHAIAERRLIDVRRREGRRARREVPGGEEHLASAPAAAASPEEGLSDEVRGALDALPDQQRRVIELMKVDGLPAREVARRTGLSESNVKVIAHRGYKALRAGLGEWFRGRH